jgi:predicted O-methyltransferase YrrM
MGATVQLQTLLAEVYAFGQANDARETQRERRMLNVTPDTGQFLAILVQALEARHVLELGTSNGYSTLWLASAARKIDGHVTTIEYDPAKVALANANFERAGLADRITLLIGDAADVLANLAGPFDLAFLDADRPSYGTYVDPLLSLLRPGGMLVTDNVVSHATELGAFLARLKRDPALDSVTVPIGNGEEVTYKRRRRDG